MRHADPPSSRSSSLSLIVGRTTGYFCTFPELNGRSNLVPKVGKKCGVRTSTEERREGGTPDGQEKGTIICSCMGLNRQGHKVTLFSPEMPDSESSSTIPIHSRYPSKSGKKLTRSAAGSLPEENQEWGHLPKTDDCADDCERATGTNGRLDGPFPLLRHCIGR